MFVSISGMAETGSDLLRHLQKGSKACPVRVLAVSAFVFLTWCLSCRDASQPEAVIASPAAGRAPGSMADSKFLQSLPEGFQLPAGDDEVGWRVLADYGAVFVARGGATPPPHIMFPDEQEVARWQSSVKTKRLEVAGITVELQTPATEAFLAARRETQGKALNISPRSGDSARRNFADTVQLWSSRVNPGLRHWAALGGLTKGESVRIRDLAPRQQIGEILRLEKRGLFFSKDFSKSILYSVAAPGTSQHISMLALDVKEHGSTAVRSILARHGWFQTVLSDLPHFTFLGVGEEDLPSLGLKQVENQGRVYWIPDLEGIGPQN